MAFTHGTIAKLYSNGYDLSGWLKNIAGQTQVVAEDATTLGKTAKVVMPGLRDGTLDIEGLWDGAALAADALLAAALGGSPVLAWLPVGDVFGSYGQGLQGVQSAYDVQTPGSALSKITGAVQSAVGWERAAILLALATKSSTAAGTGVDGLAASTNGGAAYLQVTAYTGTGGTVKVQHSADNVTYVDLATFVASASISAQRVAVTGTVYRYLRAYYTINGSSSLTIQVMFSRA